MRAKNAPRPPDLRGTRLNQFRRWVAMEAWHVHQAGHSNDVRLSQEDRDRRDFGKLYGWLVQSKAEAAAVARVGKAQAALRRRP
jgi:hypothetical protein